MGGSERAEPVPQFGDGPVQLLVAERLEVDQGRSLAEHGEGDVDPIVCPGVADRGCVHWRSLGPGEIGQQCVPGLTVERQGLFLGDRGEVSHHGVVVALVLRDTGGAMADPAPEVVQVPGQRDCAVGVRDALDRRAASSKAPVNSCVPWSLDGDEVAHGVGDENFARLRDTVRSAKRHTSRRYGVYRTAAQTL